MDWAEPVRTVILSTLPLHFQETSQIVWLGIKQFTGYFGQWYDDSCETRVANTNGFVLSFAAVDAVAANEE